MLRLVPGVMCKCIQDLIVDGRKCFIVGKTYKCISTGSLNNELGVYHYWGSYYDGELSEPITFFRYFKIVSSNKKKYYEKTKNDYGLGDDDVSPRV